MHRDFMISQLGKAFTLLVILGAAAGAPERAQAQDSCVVAGDTLKQAQDNYARQCTIGRVDCDPFGDTWVCASFQINSTTPPALTLASTTQNSADASAASQTFPTCNGPNSDPDGDGYGWENNHSCVAITDATPLQNTPSSTTGTSLLIAECSRADSDTDGDGYGWENNKTCVAAGNSTPAQNTTTTQTTATAAIASCSQSYSDPDGDGYGWENNKTCVAAGNSTPAQNTTTNQNTATAAIANCSWSNSDPDGDGYGWENNKTCVAAGNSTSAQNTTTNQTTATAAIANCSWSNSDPDGDGYGWENNKTCVAAGNSTPAQNTTTNQTTATAAIATCSWSNSDPDGDGYGWENNKTCVAAGNSTPAQNTTTNQNTATAAIANCSWSNSDPDGDGYGWENGMTCTAGSSNTAQSVQTSPANATSGSVRASDITDLILVTGQSNALGASTAYDASLDAPNSRVFAFTNNGWQVANLNQIWDLNWHPRNHPDTDPSNNFSLHFGKTVAENAPARVIGFVLASAPGQKIEHWNRDDTFYASMQAKVLDAINQLPHKSAIDGILWHQGESDGQDKQYYTNALYTLIHNLRNEPWVSANAPFICGETKIQSVNNRLNVLNRDPDPNTACVQAIDLPTRDDSIHFSAEGLRILGTRYGRAYLDIVN